MRNYLGLLSVLVAGAALATPSTLVTIPSTDIQAAKVWHLGSDSYQAEDGSAALSDTGLTYGASSRVEVGVDLFSPAASPATLNAKVLLTEPGKAEIPVAAGIYNVGKSGSAFDQRIAYLVASKSFDDGTRFTLGGYSARKSTVGDTNTGVMAGAEYLKGDWWYAVDYLSGENAIGSINAGVAYTFAPNTSVIFGYDDFNAEGLVNTYNIQVDINF
jgi:hypothetical protein